MPTTQGGRLPGEPFYTQLSHALEAQSSKFPLHLPKLTQTVPLVFPPPIHSWILTLDSLLYILHRGDVGERSLEALGLRKGSFVWQLDSS